MLYHWATETQLNWYKDLTDLIFQTIICITELHEATHSPAGILILYMDIQCHYEMLLHVLKSLIEACTSGQGVFWGVSLWLMTFPC